MHSKSLRAITQTTLTKVLIKNSSFERNMWILSAHLQESAEVVVLFTSPHRGMLITLVMMED
jgi:hypothetical protein